MAYRNLKKRYKCQSLSLARVVVKFKVIKSFLLQNVQSAQKTSKSCSENCEWKANLQAFTSTIVNAITGMLAICDLRKKSSALQQHNVPAAEDEGTVQGILDKDFPDWKEFIEQQAKKKLNKMAINEASSAATTAILPLVKSPIQTVRTPALLSGFFLSSFSPLLC